MNIDDLFNNHILPLQLDELNSIDNDLKNIIKLINILPVTTERFYTGLDEFMNPIYEKVHELLNAYGFVNGNPEANKDNHKVQIMFWVYQEVSNCIYKEPCNGDHHACTAERKEAILNSLNMLRFSISCAFKPVEVGF